VACGWEQRLPAGRPRILWLNGAVPTTQTMLRPTRQFAAKNSEFCTLLKAVLHQPTSNGWQMGADRAKMDRCSAQICALGRGILKGPAKMDVLAS